MSSTTFISFYFKCAYGFSRLFNDRWRDLNASHRQSHVVLLSFDLGQRLTPRRTDVTPYHVIALCMMRIISRQYDTNVFSFSPWILYTPATTEQITKINQNYQYQLPQHHTISYLIQFNAADC